MERIAKAIRVLELVALLLPALGIYFRFFLKNNAPNDDFEIENIHHELTTSVWLLLTIGSVLVIGFLSSIILVIFPEDIFIKVTGYLLFSAFMGVTFMSHRWYLDNLENMRESIDELINISKDRKEQLAELEKDVAKLDTSSMTYLERKRLLEDLNEIATDLSKFEPKSAESVEEMIDKLNDYFSKRQKELDTAIEESKILKDRVEYLPNKGSIKYSILNPIEYIKSGSLVIPVIIFWLVSQIFNVNNRTQWLAIGLLLLIYVVRFIANVGE